jgi:chitodextrinase
VSTTQVSLAWQPSTDDVGVTGYRVDRDGWQVGTTATNGFTDGGLAPSTTHTYYIYAYDAAGNLSDPSAPTVVTTTANSDPGSSYSTSFDQTENPISEGGKWVNGRTNGIDWNDGATADGNVHASVLTGADGSRYSDNIAHLSPSFKVFNPNQYAQGTIYRVPGYSASHEVELLLRFSISDHDAQGYEILWGVTGYLAIVRWNGQLGEYTVLYGTSVGDVPVPQDGDVMRAEMRGSMITVKINGTVVATADAAEIGIVWSSGQPGVGFWPVDDAIPENYGWKDFSAGSL